MQEITPEQRGAVDRAANLALKAVEAASETGVSGRSLLYTSMLASVLVALLCAKRGETRVVLETLRGLVTGQIDLLLERNSSEELANKIAEGLPPELRALRDADPGAMSGVDEDDW